MRGIYPGQSAARIVCDHLPSISNICGGSAVQGKGGGALLWSVAVHWVLRLWGFPKRCKPKGPPPVFCPRATIHELQSNLLMAATCAGLGSSQAKPSFEPRLAVASAMAWSLVVRGIGAGGLLQLAIACLREFRKLGSKSQDELFIWKSHC